MNLGNTYVIAAIITAAVTGLAIVTRPKRAAEAESLTSFSIKISVITFVCTYFGMVFLVSPSCPEIIQGEPDF